MQDAILTGLFVFLLTIPFIALPLGIIPVKYYRKHREHFSVKFSLQLWLIPTLVVESIALPLLLSVINDASNTADPGMAAGFALLFIVPIAYILTIPLAMFIQSSTAKSMLRS
jgi:hypothetical protein